MADTLADLPALSEPYPVTPEQIASFREHGHVLLRGVASADEVAAYRSHIARILWREHEEKERRGQRGNYHKSFIQIANLWEMDESCRRFTLAPRFGRIAAELMGVDGVRLYHDQALYKQGGGDPTPWHQDQYYWPLANPNTVTMWMPLVDCPVAMGALTFASGSHRDGSLASMAISPESEEFFRNVVAEHGFPVVHDAMAAGDATFHAGWTIHSAPANASDRTREVMTVIYMEDGMLVSEPANTHQPADLARWLPGCKPGQPAVSPLNPLIYRRP